MEFDPGMVVPDPEKSIDDGAIEPWRRAAGVDAGWTRRITEALARELKIPLDRPWKELHEKQKQALLYGTGDKRVTVKWSGKHGSGSWAMRFEGVVRQLERRFKETKSESMRQWYERYFHEAKCSACDGLRLRPESRAVYFSGQSIPD